MPSKTPIAFIDIRTFAHATEDPDKVLTALRNVLPPETVGNVVFKKTDLTGYYRNEIVLFQTKITDRHVASEVFRKLSAGLGILDKELLSGQISQHMEKGNLYLRLDKQAAYLNQIKLGQVDPIHFRIHFKRPMPDEVIAVCKEYGLVP